MNILSCQDVRLCSPRDLAGRRGHGRRSNFTFSVEKIKNNPDTRNIMKSHRKLRHICRVIGGCSLLFSLIKVCDSFLTDVRGISGKGKVDRVR